MCDCNGCGGYKAWKAEQERIEADRLAQNTLRFTVWLAEHDLIPVGEAMAVISDTTYVEALARAERREQLAAETRLNRMAEAR